MAEEGLRDGLKSMNDVTCLACGCLCDDVIVRPDGGLENACTHGANWIEATSRFQPPAPALVEGNPAQLDDAIDAAARLLVTARFPLLFGLAKLCVDGQREAVALSDVLGACLDSGGDGEDPTTYFPGVGSSGCAWGEVIQRADFIIYWRCDLKSNWWRHQERVIERIRRDRSVETVTMDDGIDTIWSLRALVQGKNIETSKHVVALARQLREANYAVIVHHGDARLEVALQALARDVNLITRCRVIDLGSPFNAAGQSQVTRWQTGYTRAVGFHRGYPVSFSREFAAETMLSRGEADAVVSSGSAADDLSPVAQHHLSTIPHVVIATDSMPKTLSPQITLFTSTPGVNANGVAFRSDGLTLRLRSPFSSSLPAPALVIKRLTDAIRRMRG